jgi:hypothetical protein
MSHDKVEEHYADLLKRMLESSQNETKLILVSVGRTIGFILTDQIRNKHLVDEVMGEKNAVMQ